MASPVPDPGSPALDALYRDAFSAVERALADVRGGNQASAKVLYMEAVQYFLQAADLDSDVRRRELVHFQVADYIHRIEQLSAAEQSDMVRNAPNALISAPADVPPHREQASPHPSDVSQPELEAAAQGKFCLEQALLQDEQGCPVEALPLYTQAAEAYLTAVRLTEDAERKAKYRARVKDVIARAEDIKQSTSTAALASAASSSSAPVTPLTHSASPARPASTSFAAADHSRKGSATASPVGVAGEMDLSALQAVLPDAPAVPTDGAGEVAAAAAAGAAGGGGDAHVRSRSAGSARGGAAAADGKSGVQRKPSGTNMTKSELEVLRRSSVINGKLYMPWLDIDTAERFVYPSPFEDPDGLLPLDRKQRKRLGGWVRPSQFVRGEPRMINIISAYSITQDVVGDCSFVSSLCVCAAYERRFKKQLVTRIIFPQDRQGNPVYNPSGKYMVKLFFNGIERKVVVDDRLPIDHRGKLLCACSNNRSELWVSIIEKAYMKVNGGYDFPGSTSGIDLYALTGWIPEQVHMNDKDFDSERTWQRLANGVKFGDCLATIATGEMSEAESERWGLVPSHAYAVLDVREVMGKRLLQVKNPWSHRRWRGPYSAEDTTHWTTGLKRALSYDQVGAMQYDNGIFWIDFVSVTLFFRVLYMSWNPELFAHRRVAHASWSMSAPGPANDTYNLGYNPQYALVVNAPPPADPRKPGTSAVWLLLSRHVTSKDRLLRGFDERSQAAAGAGAEAAEDDGDYLTVHVYSDTGGRRVYYPHGAMLRGTYTNNPHELIRFDVPPGKHALTLVLSQYVRRCSIDYTLRVLCMAPCELLPLPAGLRHEQQLVHAWTEDTAGGSGRYATFMNNPQWRLTLPADTLLALRLSAPVDFAVNVRLLRGGERVLVPSAEAEVATSGDYRRGFCYVECRVPAGAYTVVPSTFDPGCVGSFILSVGASACAPALARLPAEGEGMHCQVLRGAWRVADSTAAGCANFGQFPLNPKFRLRVPAPITLLARLQVPDASPPPAINVAVFPCAADGLPASYSMEAAAAASNQSVYSNPVCGVATPATRIAPGTYVILPSTFHPGVEAQFRLLLYSSQPVVCERLA